MTLDPIRRALLARRRRNSKAEHAFAGLYNLRPEHSSMATLDLFTGPISTSARGASTLAQGATLHHVA